MPLMTTLVRNGDVPFTNITFAWEELLPLSILVLNTFNQMLDIDRYGCNCDNIPGIHADEADMQKDTEADIRQQSRKKRIRDIKKAL